MPIIDVQGIGRVEFPDDMSLDQIQESIETELLPQFPEVAAGRERSFGEAATDVAASLGTGVGRLMQVPGQIGQLAGMYGPDEADTGIQGLGQQLEEFSQEAKSPTLIGKESLRAQEVQQADGQLAQFGTFLKETVTDPALLTSFFTEQIPNLVGSMGGGMLARGGVSLLMREATEQALGKIGTAGAVGTGAAMQGADVGSETYERIYKELEGQGVEPEEANRRALEQARKAAIGAAGTTIATSYLIPGGTSIERALAGKGAPGVGGFVRGTAGEVAQETLEETGGQFASNVAVAQEIPGTSLTEGLGQAAASGVLGGGLFGGPAGAISGRRDARTKAEADRIVKAVEQEAERRRALEKQETERRQALAQDGRLFSSEELGGEVVGPPPIQDVEAAPASDPAFNRVELNRKQQVLEQNIESLRTSAKQARDTGDNNAVISLGKQFGTLKAELDATKKALAALGPAPKTVEGLENQRKKLIADRDKLVDKGQLDKVAPIAEKLKAIDNEITQVRRDTMPPDDLLSRDPITFDSPTGQLGLPGIGVEQLQPTQAEPLPAPTVTETGQLEIPGMGVGRETAVVTENDFTRMGIGKTNKKLRQQILGKDLGVPEQAAQVRGALENYASGKERSAKIIEGVESFLRRPEFAVQLPLAANRIPVTPRPQYNNENWIEGLLAYGRPTAPTEVTPPAVEEGVLPTVITEASVNDLALPKGSAYRNRLVGKDLSKPTQRKQVAATLKEIVGNRRVKPETRERVQDILNSAMALRTQGEMFGPRGGVTQAARQPREGGADARTTDIRPITPEPTVRGQSSQRGVAVADVGAGSTGPTTSAPGAVQTPDGAGLAATDRGTTPDTGRGAGEPATVTPPPATGTQTPPPATGTQTPPPATGTQTPPAETPAPDFISWVQGKGISITDPNQDWKALEREWDAESGQARAQKRQKQERSPSVDPTPSVDPIPSVDETPPVEQTTAPPTPEQKDITQRIAALFDSGVVVYEDGDLALVRTVDRKDDIIYLPVKGTRYAKIDIDKYISESNTIFTEEESKKLSEAKRTIEGQDRARHKASPFINFMNGMASSQTVPSELTNILREWKNILGVSANIYLTNMSDIAQNVDSFTGPHRTIMYKLRTESGMPRGFMRYLKDGSYVIAYTESTSLTRMFETIAHELGHVHEVEVFKNAPLETKKAIQQAHAKWVKSVENKTAGDVIRTLRARQGVRSTKGDRTMPAKNLSPYWTSFAEWYADQVSKWAMSSQKPQTVVEKFFAKLGAAMRRFYNSLKGQGYLPDQTLKQYLDSISPEIGMSDMKDPAALAWEDMKPEGAPPFDGLFPQYKNSWRRAVERNRATMAEAEVLTEAQRQAAREWLDRGGERGSKPQLMVDNLEPQISNPLLEDISQRAGGISETPPPKTAFQKVKETGLRNSTKEFLNRAETNWFSFDAGFQNRIAEELRKSKDAQAAIESVQKISTSQALHADGVAIKFLEKGNAVYRPDLHMYEATNDSNNYLRLIDTLSSIAEEEGVSFDRMKQYANQAFIAERINGMSKTDKEFYSNLSDAEVKAGLEFFTAIPRLREVQNIWNGIRSNAMKMAVDSGLYTEQEARDLLNVMDYVPFFREGQLEVGAGPKEYGRGLLDYAKGRKIKGSDQKVNDIFNNMERWTSYLVSRSVKNRTANNMLQLAQEVFPDEVTPVRTDDALKKEERQNVIDIYVGGERRRFKFADPMFVDAFGSMASITMPLTGAMGGFAVKMADFLRKTVVLVPIFSISQLSQDSFSAMYTSGLQKPLKIPFEVVNEFFKTLRGTSSAHERLGDVAAAGVRDYSATVARNDVEVAAGLKKPGTGRRIYDALEKFAMASDNAVRQAIYNRTLLETGGVKLADGTIRGGDEATAVRRAFEVINFKRSGKSGFVQVAKQVVPFFGAYLQSMNVMYKVLAGRGISPQERARAYATLAATTAKVMTLALLYTALVADDEEYQEMDPAMRDRTLMIPGTSFKLPMRPDIFLLPKLVAEYGYLTMTDEGYTDGTKIRRAFRDAVSNAILSPTAVPQAVKPALEVGINYSFFTGRPIIGRGLERLPTEQQYSSYTSELARIIGNSGLISPVNADHLMRGYLGTAGGMMNALISSVVRATEGRSVPDVPLPDDIASIPGLGAFVTRTYGSGVKNDFYEMRKEIDTAVAGLNWLKKYRTPEEVREYLQANRDLISLRTPTNRIVKQLSKIRQQERKVREAPDSKLSAAEKGQIIERLREMERRILARVPELRQRAGM